MDGKREKLIDIHVLGVQYPIFSFKYNENDKQFAHFIELT